MTRGDEPSRLSCDHANEVPGSVCTCPVTCPCRLSMCRYGKPKPPAVSLQVRVPRQAYLSNETSGCSDVEFDEHVAATERTADGRLGGLDYCLLKLAAEAGEAGQLRAKEILAGHGSHPRGGANAPEKVLERRARYALELGDTLWYLTEACRLLGLTVGQVKRLNMLKLRRRRLCVEQGLCLPTGKDPAAEQADAVRFLFEPDTHVEAEPEFDACVGCGDETRHHAHAMTAEGVDWVRLCRAPSCRELEVSP